MTTDDYPTTIYRVADGAWFDFDATLEESHEASADVTTHPIEDGSVVGDHVAERPARVAIRAVVTESPFSASEADGGVGRINAARAFLRGSFGVSLLVGTTRYGVLDGYVLESVRDRVDNKRIATFDLSFVYVATVASSTVAIPARAPTARAAAGLPTATDGGPTAPAEVDPDADPAADADRSYAYAAAHALGLL